MRWKAVSIILALSILSPLAAQNLFIYKDAAFAQVAAPDHPAQPGNLQIRRDPVFQHRRRRDPLESLCRWNADLRGQI